MHGCNRNELPTNGSNVNPGNPGDLDDSEN